MTGWYCVSLLVFLIYCALFFWRKVYFFLLYCAIKKRLQCGVTVWRPGVDCVQETFYPSSFCSSGSFSLTDIQLVYLWRFLCWQMYSFYRNFPLLNMKSSGMQRRRGRLFVFLFVCLRGALRESILQRDLPRHRLSWKDDDVPRLLPFHYVKRESRAIRISACYDKSGSSEKKKYSFFVLWGCHWAFGSFFR